MRNPPSNRPLVLLKENPCPQCLATGGLLVGSVLEGWTPGESTMFARWRPVLMCEGCDLHVVGEYGPGGNIAAFENLGDPKDPSSRVSD